MTTLSVLILLAILFQCLIIILTMSKIADLSAAVSTLATATTDLSIAVDKAIEKLGAPSTPDTEIVPVLEALSTITVSVNNATAKLNAATA
jgi:hypothetical protein